MALRAPTLAPAEGTSLEAWLTDIAQRAQDQSVRATPAQLARFLQELLGQPIVAYMVGVDDPESVGQWARGERVPRAETEQRLRDAYQIAKVIVLADDAETARAWFIGMNPPLGDRAPFAVLADDPQRAPLVLSSAKSFVSG